MGRTSRIPEGFYSAAQAIKKLGTPRSTFYTLDIEKVIAPGRKDAYYPKSVIDDMVKAREMFLIQYAIKPAIFAKATTDDIEAIYDVAVSLWGTAGTIGIETRRKWYQSNSDIDYVVKQDGIIVGFVSLMPLKHETIEKLMSGDIRGWDITSDDVLPFTPGASLECFVMAIAVRSGVKKAEKYGMRLLIGAIHTLGELAKNGITIDKIYATSITPDGIKACRDLGFEELESLPGMSRKRFIMDVATSTSPLLQEYHDKHSVKGC
jgi:hypothetical protein